MTSPDTTPLAQCDSFRGMWPWILVAANCFASLNFRSGYGPVLLPKLLKGSLPLGHKECALCTSLRGGHAHFIDSNVYAIPLQIRPVLVGCRCCTRNFTCQALPKYTRSVIVWKAIVDILRTFCTVPSRKLASIRWHVSPTFQTSPGRVECTCSSVECADRRICLPSRHWPAVP